MILYLHDCADMWLEAAKLANYAKIQKVCDILFMIFGVVFFVTRILFYPTYVAYAYFHYNTYDHGWIVKVSNFFIHNFEHIIFVMMSHF